VETRESKRGELPGSNTSWKRRREGKPYGQTLKPPGGTEKGKKKGTIGVRPCRWLEGGQTITAKRKGLGKVRGRKEGAGGKKTRGGSCACVPGS